LSRTEDANEENELLLLQLHQVQEELERYFLMHREAESAKQDVETDLQRVKKALRLEKRKQHTPIVLAGKHWDYADIELVQHIEEPGYESLWVALHEAKFGERHWPRFEFRLSMANQSEGGFSEQPHYEFPELPGEAQAFESWSVESDDAVRGPRFEIRFHLGQGAVDMNAFDSLTADDKLQFVALMGTISQFLDDIADEVAEPDRGWGPWRAINDEALKVLRGIVGQGQ